MRLLLNLVVVGVVLSSCNAVEPSEESPAIASRQDALSSPPRSLTNWRWGTPFFPSTAKSAYLVAVQHPTDPTAFVAWGFDVVTGNTYFSVTGSTRTDFPRLLSQVSSDVSISAQFDDEFTHHIATQVGKKGPGHPPPPGNDWTQMNAYGANIAAQLHAAHRATF